MRTTIGQKVEWAALHHIKEDSKQRFDDFFAGARALHRILKNKKKLAAKKRREKK